MYIITYIVQLIPGQLSPEHKNSPAPKGAGARPEDQRMRRRRFSYCVGVSQMHLRETTPKHNLQKQGPLTRLTLAPCRTSFAKPARCEVVVRNCVGVAQ